MLRDYQQAMVDETRQHWREGRRRVLVVAPTGAGKTHVLAHAAKETISRGHRVAVIVHRRELLEQAVRALAGYDLVPDGRDLLVTTIQTATRREHDHFGLVVVDEAHLSLAPTWRKFIEAQDTYTIGLTATPYRLDGRGLGDIWHALVQGPGVHDLIAGGLLSRARTFAPAIPDLSDVSTKAGDWDEGGLSAIMMRPQITGSIIEHYRKLAGDRQALAFCVNIAHSKRMQEEFFLAGLSCEHVDGVMPKKKRDALVAEFRAGTVRILTCCDLLSEGFDLPDLGCIILARPTQSEVKYRQQIGRGCRRTETKDEFIILDHAGNALRHGLYSDFKKHTLEGSKRSSRNRKEPSSAVRQCLSCYGVYNSVEDVCPYCGAAPPLKERKTREVNGVLVELEESGVVQLGGYKQIMRSVWQSPRSDWEKKLWIVARQMNYKPGWVRKQLVLKLSGEGRRTWV